MLDDHEDFLDYDMVEFEDSDLHDILAIHKLNDTTLDKLNFTVFSMNIAVTGFLAGYLPAYFYIFHTLKVIVLLTNRWYTYKQSRNHYFMFDFCYFTNILLLVYLWSPWKLGVLFPVLFSLSNGPLLLSVFLWRNSLVPHSADKMTSLLIHLSPALTLWGIRWHSTEDQGFVMCANPIEGGVANGCGHIGWMDLILLPMIVSLVWVLIYSLIVFIWRGKHVKERNYSNSYTYLVENAKRKPLVKLFNILGPQYRKVVYLIWHIVYILISTLMSFYTFFSIEYNMFLYLIVLAIACYNGASFYIDVIGHHYYQKKKELEEK